MSETDQKIEIRYFSGYIRNWKKLCEELGIDTSLNRKEREAEILRNAYAKWKMEMMDHLYGMFAFSIWDSCIQNEFCVRDQVGQKQMFYSVIDGEFVCSGDINEIVSDSHFEKKLNKRMLQQYLFYGYPIGSDTFYEGVYKLMPGHYAEWDGNEVTLHCYFKPVFEPDRTKSVDEYAELIKNTVDEILDEERGDTEIPYKDYLNEIKGTGMPLDKYIAERERYIQKQNAGQAKVDTIKHYWDLLFRTGDRFELYEQYAPIRQELLEMRDEGRYDELRAALAPYREKLMKNYKLGLGLCFDPEIFDCMLEVLRREGSGALAAELKEMIPPEHMRPIVIKGYDDE